MTELSTTTTTTAAATATATHSDTAFAALMRAACAVTDIFAADKKDVTPELKKAAAGAIRRVCDILGETPSFDRLAALPLDPFSLTVAFGSYSQARSLQSAIGTLLEKTTAGANWVVDLLLVLVMTQGDMSAWMCITSNGLPSPVALPTIEAEMKAFVDENDKLPKDDAYRLKDGDPTLWLWALLSAAKSISIKNDDVPTMVMLANLAWCIFQSMSSENAAAFLAALPASTKTVLDRSRHIPVSSTAFNLLRIGGVDAKVFDEKKYQTTVRQLVGSLTLGLTRVSATGAKSSGWHHIWVVSVMSLIYPYQEFSDIMARKPLAGELRSLILDKSAPAIVLDSQFNNPHAALARFASNVDIFRNPETHSAKVATAMYDCLSAHVQKRQLGRAIDQSVLSALDASDLFGARALAAKWLEFADLTENVWAQPGQLNKDFFKSLASKDEKQLDEDPFLATKTDSEIVHAVPAAAAPSQEQPMSAPLASPAPSHQPATSTTEAQSSTVVPASQASDSMQVDSDVAAKTLVTTIPALAKSPAKVVAANALVPTPAETIAGSSSSSSSSASASVAKVVKQATPSGSPIVV